MGRAWVVVDLVVLAAALGCLAILASDYYQGRPDGWPRPWKRTPPATGASTGGGGEGS